MKRFVLLVGIIFQSVVLTAQTPQELQLLHKRLKSFAYAIKVEQADSNNCKIWLSSGDSLVLGYGTEKSKPFQSVVVNTEEVVAKPHKGKPIRIGRIPNQAGALTALYKATKGKLWSRNSNWGKLKQGIGNWEGVTCNEQGYVTQIKLNGNDLQGNLPDVFYAFPKLQKLLINKNQLTGELPRSLAWLPENCTIDIRFNKFALTTLYVPRHRIPTVAQNIRCYPQQTEHSDFRLFVDCDIDLNPTKGHYPDNHCRLYHKATEGAGINIYVVGEGYDKAEYAIGGTAEYWLERAADAIFDIKPFCQLKHLFNVYIISTYSPERGIALFDNTRNSRFGYWLKRPKGQSQTFKKQEVFDTCKKGATNAGFQFEKGTVYVHMVANCTQSGGVEYSHTVRDGDKKRHIRIGINPTHTKLFNPLVWHEFGGHAFGRLLDEYNRGGLKKTYKKSTMDRANLDLESDPKKVKWAKFIADPRYAEEKIGVYKGALGCSNLYRATKTSIMRSNVPKQRFNAPSRAEIYKVAMELAFPDWKFDYETFVKFDLGDKYYPLDKITTMQP